MKLQAIGEETHRGVVLDAVVFTVNVLLMTRLTQYAVDLLRRAGEGDVSARAVLAVGCFAMFVLPAAGAVLKRWHYHERVRARRHPKPFQLSIEQSGAGNYALGCLCNPIFFFVLSIVVAAGVMSLVEGLTFGRKAPAAFVVPATFLVVALCVTQTVLIYRYFAPPRRAPVAAFWRDRRSELAGDACIFVNMMLFQVAWNIVMSDFPSMEVTHAGHLAGNAFFLIFVALLIYFPPRIFYLAEDIHRPSTWLMMLLANAPGIYRALFPAIAEWRAA